MWTCTFVAYGQTAVSSGAQVGARYVDRVINESEAADTAVRAEDAGEEPRGLRSLSISYSLNSAQFSDGSKRLENGVDLRGQRETLDYGILDVIASGYHTQESQLPGSGLTTGLVPNNNGNRLTLSQSRFAFNNNFLMDNSLGATQSLANGVVSRSFRTNLVSGPVEGVSTRLYDIHGNEMNFVSGRLGQFEGLGGTGFGTTQGQMTGAGMQTRISSNWMGGLQAWDVKGAPNVADHSSVAMAGDYRSPDALQRFQLHGLGDSNGHAGIWLDGESRSTALIQHFGISRFEQDLAYADMPFSGGQQGIYWRADSVGLIRSYSLGAELSETNFQKRPDLGTSQSTLLYGTINERIDRLTSIGGNLNLNRQQSENPVTQLAGAILPAPANRSRADLIAFVNRVTGLGASRLQLTYGLAIEGIADQTYGAQWDQEFATVGIRTSLAYLYDNSAAAGTLPGTTMGQTKRTTASVMSPGFNLNSARINGSLSVYQLIATGQATQYGIQSNASARWQISRHWSMQANLSWNQVRNPDLAAQGVPVGAERILLFQLRYENVAGTPYYGSASAGPPGSSRIAGIVFFDDNGDGIQQAGEKAAANITVILDQRYQTKTDANGRYEFSPISPGTHSVTLRPDGIPLPWGLLDESPRSVNARLRSESDSSFPLRKLNQ